MDALTAYELSRYRRQLEHALKAAPVVGRIARDFSSASPRPGRTAPRTAITASGDDA